MSKPSPKRKSAYERTKEMRLQVTRGMRVAPAVHVVLLAELCEEFEQVLEENNRLKAAAASSARADKK